MNVDFIDEQDFDTSVSRPTVRQKQSLYDMLQQKFNMDKNALRAIAISAIILFLFSSAIFVAVGLSKQKELRDTRQDFINRFSPPQNAPQPTK
jgi:tmRNA-binding protein